MEKEPEPELDCSASPPVTYTNSISQILNNSCLSCHHDSGNLPHLNDYTAVNTNAARIMKAVNHQSGALPMPQGANKLDASLLAKFKCWEANGFKE